MRKTLSSLLAAAMLLALALPVPAAGEDGPADAGTAESRGEIRALSGERLARTEILLDGGEDPGVCTRETNLGDLVADALLWYATKDGELAVERQYVVAVTNGGGIRASIRAGDVTRGDINAALPLGNTVAVVYVSGAKLLEALEAATFRAPEALGDFPQVSGMELTVNTAVPYDQGELYGETAYRAPASIGRVTIHSAGGWTFDEDATYAVVTNDDLAAGGNAYYALSASDTIVDTGAPMDEVVMDYITGQLGGVVTAAAYGEPRGRIHIVSESAAPAMWYDEAVKTVTAAGLMTGAGNGFEPEGVVTRATVFQALYNMEGRPEAADPMDAWPDVRGKWYESAARWARSIGLAQGTGGGFEGDRAVTRGEIVTILGRYARYKGVDTDGADQVELLTYADGELVTDWSVDAFRWAVGAGIIAGKASPDGALLAPTDRATRAELAQILADFSETFLPSRPVVGRAEELTLPESREDYPSDGAYANFRAVAVGNIAPGALYRSSSPIDPGQGDRRFTADRLARDAGVATVVNTSDCRLRFTGFEGFEDTYYATLDHVALNMGKDYRAEGFVEDLRNGLDFMSENEGPYLIHGTQGVERTGYVCMVLEAFMGADREEILDDYMRSYRDYYQLEPESGAWAALEAKAEGYLTAFAGSGRSGADLARAAEDFLLHTVGLTPRQVELLRERLS